MLIDIVVKCFNFYLFFSKTIAVETYVAYDFFGSFLPKSTTIKSRAVKPLLTLHLQLFLVSDNNYHTLPTSMDLLKRCINPPSVIPLLCGTKKA